MKTVKLLLLLLIPAALFFASCQNELPEETFFIEEYVYPNGGDPHYHLSDVDYFELELRKLNPNPTIVAGVPETNDPYNELLPYDIHLEKGEVLRLEGLEPGYYKINGFAYKINEDYNHETYEESGLPDDAEFIYVGAVSGKSDRMYHFDINNTNYIIVEEDSPVIIKLVFFGGDNL